MSDSNKNNNDTTTQPEDLDLFHGAALVLKDGREVPITETMVQHALATMEQQCHGLCPQTPQSGQQHN